MFTGARETRVEEPLHTNVMDVELPQLNLWNEPGQSKTEKLPTVFLTFGQRSTTHSGG